jgi:hypothetical protein
MRIKRRDVLVGTIVGCALAAAAGWVAFRGSTEHAAQRPSTSSQRPAAVSPNKTDGPPADGGYFRILPPGARLPSDAQCAARVHRSSWEPRPANAESNRTVPTQPVSIAPFSQYTETWNSRYLKRVSGNFRGHTDEIIQWAACKWGWSDDLVRAEAVRESNWLMSNEGDFEPRSRGHCTYDDGHDPCPTSFGILQIKWYFHPAVSNPRVGSSYPLSRKSTAFNIDLQLAELRGCYDGMSTYLGNTRGDVWGCVGYWFSGAWHTAASDHYSAIVQNLLAKKPWRGW